MIVGLAGHIDHGKTALAALVKALTGVQGDRLKDEKARGVTIDLGFAFMERPGAPSASSTSPAMSVSSTRCSRGRAGSITPS